jgi:hypothetical protein
MNVVDLKTKKRAKKRTPRDLVQLGESTGAGRFFARLVGDVERDLGGTRHCTRIEHELVLAFAGCATALQYISKEIVLGEAVGEIDLSAYATLASTMLRLGAKLGLGRRAHEIAPSLDHYLALKAQNQPDAEASPDEARDEAQLETEMSE